MEVKKLLNPDPQRIPTMLSDMSLYPTKLHKALHYFIYSKRSCVCVCVCVCQLENISQNSGSPWSGSQDF